MPAFSLSIDDAAAEASPVLWRMRMDGLYRAALPFAERHVQAWRGAPEPDMDVDVLLNVIKVWQNQKHSAHCLDAEGSNGGGAVGGDWSSGLYYYKLRKRCTGISGAPSVAISRDISQPGATQHWQLQVAHFLEADLQPWAAALAAALFAPQPADERREQAWNLLDALVPLGDAVDRVLRTSELPRTPAEWQPALMSSRVVAGSLELSYREAAACCDLMPAVRGVHALTFRCASEAATALAATGQDADEAEAVEARACTAVTSLSALRTLKLCQHTSSEGHTDKLPLTLLPTLERLSQLAELEVECRRLDLGALAPPCLLYTSPSPRD